MSDTQSENAVSRQEEVAGVLPVLAQLDRTAADLEEKTASGQLTAADVTVYEHLSAHARHLVDVTGTDHREVAEAEKDHRGDGDKGFAARGLDHATHPRSFELPLADTAQTRDRDDEEIDL